MYVGSLEAQSNTADWEGAYQLWDTDADEYIDISGCSITMTVTDENGCQVLIGSTDGGDLTIEDSGIFTWNYAASRLGSICTGTYSVGIRISQNGVTRQLFIGTLPVLDGIDRQ